MASSATNPGGVTEAGERCFTPKCDTVAVYALLPLLVMLVCVQCEDVQQPQDSSGEGPFPVKNGLELISASHQTLGLGMNEIVGGNYAYPIIVRAYQNRAPCDNVPIYLDILVGDENKIDLGASGAVYTGTIYSGFEDSLTGAVLFTSISLNDTVSSPCSFLIQAYTDDGSVNNPSDVIFSLFFILDDEPSGFGGDEAHETSTTPIHEEIPGDLLADGDSDKDLLIELDFDEWWTTTAGVDTADLANEMESILSTAGIDASVSSHPMADLLRGEVSWKACKSTLASCRNHRDRLHVLLTWGRPGSDISDGGGDAVLGGNVHYYGPGTPDNFGKYKCRAYASCGGAVSESYLDSVGCIVFGRAVELELDANPGWQNRWNNYTCVLAYLLCHEIGHALGRTKHNDEYADTTGVMTCARFYQANHSYDKFNYFIGWFLCSTSGRGFPNEKDAINLRDVLGITTIDISS